jgi:hypothetical protein
MSRHAVAGQAGEEDQGEKENQRARHGRGF